MADEEQGKSDVVPSRVQEVIAQLRRITEGLEGLTGFGGRLPSAGEVFPLPGALSAAQVASIADSIGAQRQSIQALQAQLSAFDQQLGVLEQILGPLAEWSSTWAGLEQHLLHMRPGPKPGGRAGSS